MAWRLEIVLDGQPPALPRGRQDVDLPPPAGWPFDPPVVDQLPDGPVTLVVDGLHDAFINHQTANTRLVTTQAGFLWLSLVASAPTHDVHVVATASTEALSAHAPELLAKRGPFGNVVFVTGGEDKGWAGGGATSDLSPTSALLAAAFRAESARERLAACIAALDLERTPATLVATGSACMETQDLEAAARVLDEAIGIAPAWPAARYERAKLWLRADDMDAASREFAEAARLLPTFGAAWSNLGAALGELDRPAEALQALLRALDCDGASAQTLNNIGVLRRELGQLAEAETAFRDATSLAPDLAFGYYNLGHTLFLAGRYHAALTAYAEGQRRDEDHNPMQASRLAMCRLATGDARGATADLRRVFARVSGEMRRQLAADTQTIAWALLTHQPTLVGWTEVNALLADEGRRG